MKLGTRGDHPSKMKGWPNENPSEIFLSKSNKLGLVSPGKCLSNRELTPFNIIVFRKTCSNMKATKVLMALWKKFSCPVKGKTGIVT